MNPRLTVYGFSKNLRPKANGYSAATNESRRFFCSLYLCFIMTVKMTSHHEKKMGKLLSSELSRRRVYTRREFTLYKKSAMRKSLAPVQSDVQRKTNTRNLSNKSSLTTDCIPKPVLTFARGIVVITITVGFKWLALHGFTKIPCQKEKKNA